MVQLDTFNKQKSPPLASLPATKEENSPNRGLLGWRCSADRTRLHAISLLSGNLFNWKFCNSEAFGDGFGARTHCAAAKPVTLGKYCFSRPLAFSLDSTLPSTLRVAEVDFDLRCQQEA